jgi:hypothetical protein
MTKATARLICDPSSFVSRSTLSPAHHGKATAPLICDPLLNAAIVESLVRPKNETNVAMRMLKMCPSSYIDWTMAKTPRLKSYAQTTIDCSFCARKNTPEPTFATCGTCSGPSCDVQRTNFNLLGCNEQVYSR